jgi:hypothetical protein
VQFVPAERAAKQRRDDVRLQDVGLLQVVLVGHPGGQVQKSHAARFGKYRGDSRSRQLR